MISVQDVEPGMDIAGRIVKYTRINCVNEWLTVIVVFEDDSREVYDWFDRVIVARSQP